MAQDATIISASLNDSELKQSVDSLVQYVKDGTDRMVKNTDKAVEEMKRAIQSLNSLGSVSDGGSSKRTKKQQEETQAVKETTAALKEQKVTYDQTAQAMHKAFATQQSKRYDVSDIQSLRMQQHALEAQIASTEKAQKNNSSYQEALENTKRQFMQLSQLRSEYESKQGLSQREVRDLQHITREYERVKKVLNELVNFKSGGFNVLNDQTAKLEKLRAEYNSVLSKIKEIGQSLIDNDFMQKIAAQNAEQGLMSQTRAYDDLLKRIEQIKSAKEAKKVYTDISLMPINSLETAQQKIAEIQALLNKVNGTPLLSKSNIKDLENALASAKLQLRSYEGQTEKSAESQKKLGEYVAKSASRQESFTKEIINTGLAAQQTARNVMASINEQMASGSGKQVPVDQIYELLNLFKQMNSAYYSEGVDRESPIYKSLMKDLNAIREVIKEVSKYNNAIFKDNSSGGVGVTRRSTVESLRKEISSLTSEYNKMTIAQINAGKADDLIKNFQNANRAAQVLQRTLSRPIDLKSAMGLKAGTLDEIAYKMQMLSAYRANLNIFGPKQKSEIEQVNAALKDLEKTQRKIMGENESMLKSNNALTRSFNYMKNRLAFYFTVGASTAFVKTLIDIRSQYEMNERALGILIDSAEKGTQVFKELSSMALVSPYTLIELSNAAKQLTAYGVAARDVVDTTRRLADISAAVGAPVERIAYALGHIQTYGYLTSLQARQFANSGIPLVKELAERYSELEGRVVSTADVYDRMKKKQVEYADVMDVINRMTDEGGRFFDFQAKMADTLKVQLANLNLAYNNMLNDMGKESQGIIVGAIKGLKQLFLAWKSIDKAIYDVLWTLGSAKLLQVIRIASIGLGAFGKQMTWNILVGKKLSSVIFSLASSFKALVLSPATWAAALSFAVVSATRDLMNLNEAQKEFNKSLREAGENNSKSLSDFLSQYDGGKKPIKNEDAEKIWVEMREQIDLTVKKSDEFVGSLLKISDVSERLKKGFELINDINEVNAALQELDNDSIKIEADFSKWWNLNLWPDGLVENIQKYTKAQKELNELKSTGESLSEQIESTDDLAKEYQNLESSVIVTTESIRDFIELKGWEGNINKINIAFDQILGKFAENNGLSPQEAFNMQMAAESSRSIATEKALKIRIADEEAALKVATDEETRYEIQQRKRALEQEFLFFAQNTDESRVYWRDFTNWIKTQHLAETQAMFKGMNAEQIKSLNFQEGKYFEWIDKLTKQYAKEHNKTYSETFDLLRNYVTNANQMSIFIPLVIGTDKKKSLYEELTGADSDIDAAQKKIKRLTQRRNELLEKGGRISNDKKVADDTIRAEKELVQAQKDYNDALEKGGHLKDNNKKKDPVLDSLKTEISLVEKLQGDYEKLTKAGASSKDALDAIHNAYGSTINLLNKNLQGFGLPRLDLSMITGKNPNEQLNYFKELKSLLESNGLANLERIKALDAVIEKLNVKAETYNLDMVTKGLNNELGKLKEDYELGVEFDANPELGDVFADMIGIDKSELAALPRSYEEFIARAQERINKLFADNNIKLDFNLQDNLNMSKFDEWVKSSGQEVDSKLVEDLKKYVSEANKIRLNETKKQIEEWDKLLSKYAEYEYKKLQIEKDYQREMEVARKKGADDDIKRAIQNNRDREMAKVNFEQFQQTPTWVTATGDLATMTNEALGLLINRIEEYKRTAKDLDPKQITEINKALRRLRTEQRKDSPFAIMGTAVEEAKSKVETYQILIDQAGERIDALNAKLQKESYLTEAETKELSDLIEATRKWREEQAAAGKIPATTILKGMKDVTSSVTSAMGDMFAALGDSEMQEALKKVENIFDKSFQFASLGSAFGKSGAAIGGIIGMVFGLFSSLADVISGNASITKQVEQVERNIKRLENTLKELEYTANQSFGALISGAQRATLENKRLQLAELERELTLEQSRKQKNIDADKIIDLQGKIADLRREITEGAQDIVNELLGISSAGDGITQLVDVMINAFKNGEDAMEAFGDKWDEMIDNMILKLFVTTYMQKAWDNVMKTLNEKEAEFTEEAARKKTEAQNVLSAIEGLTTDQLKSWYADYIGLEDVGYTKKEWFVDEKEMYAFIEAMKQQLVQAQNDIDNASLDWTKWSIDYMSNEGRDAMLKQAEMLKEGLGDWFTFGQDGEGQLSNLQQGIQGITETTANALESYMNGVSQQVYLHSDLLTQIRDTLVGFDMDVQTATQAQMLLQLQQSYAVQLAIQSLLQGWSSANGMAVKVEMI